MSQIDDVVQLLKDELPWSPDRHWGYEKELAIKILDALGLEEVTTIRPKRELDQ